MRRNCINKTYGYIPLKSSSGKSSTFFFGFFFDGYETDTVLSLIYFFVSSWRPAQWNNTKLKKKNGIWTEVPLTSHTSRRSPRKKKKTNNNNNRAELMALPFKLRCPLLSINKGDTLWYRQTNVRESEKEIHHHHYDEIP